MKYITPDYYKEFCCIADACSDTCCAGWEITIDPKSIKNYQKIKGPLGNRLHNSIDWKQHTFLQYDHKCIFLNEDNLCDLYTEAGPDSLCLTCKQYPRHTESYLNVRELSIAISCPEVARMLLSRRDQVIFETKEVSKREEVDVAFPQKLFERINEARQVMFNILQDRTIELKFRMGLVLGLAHDLQKRIVSRNYESMERLIAHYGKKETQQSLINKLDCGTWKLYNPYKCKGWKRLGRTSLIDGRSAFIKNVWKELLHLDALNKEWPEEIKQAQQVLNQLTVEQYRRAYQELYQRNPNLTVQMEQLIVYFIYGYTNGSVYDGEFYAKVKFAVFHAMAIEELFFAAWVEDSDSLTLLKQVDIAHKYAREIEHLDQNIDYLEKVLKEKREFDFESFVCGIYDNAQMK